MIQMRTRFLAEVVQDGSGRVAHDVFQPEAAPLPLEATIPEGSYQEVVVEGGRARPLGEVFAPPGSHAATLVRLALHEGLDPGFPEAVEREVAAILKEPGLDDPRLVDRTDLPFVTIDNADSRDLDQAIWVGPGDDGGHVVRYALSDAAHYVRPGTALHAEALDRGASYYLPGWMIPMLPRDLCEDLVSLNPGVLRRAVVFEMHLDAEGHGVATRVERARIRSRAKLSYPGVQRYLDARAAGDAHPYDGRDFAASLVRLAEVGRLRIADQREREVVRPRRQEVAVGLTERRGFSLLGGLRVPVDAYNEQISLLCNVEGARLLREGGADERVQAVFRVHPAPEARRVDGFERFLARLVRAHGLDAATWGWSRGGETALASYLAALPQGGAEGRLARAIHRQAVLLNVRSTFADRPAPHYGVGSDVYARFSAPMREIVGVFLHKELLELLGMSTPAARADDEALRERIIEQANASRVRQGQLARRAHHLALDALFEEDLAKGRPRRPGTVMGVTRSKLHLTLDDPPVDVKLYRRDLEPHLGTALRLDEDDVGLVREDGRPFVRVGDRLDVRVAGHDDDRDRWVLLPVEGGPGPAAGSPGATA
jgi:ribonuclease R